MDPKSEKLLLTVNEAAQVLALSPRKLWTMTKAGEIPSLKLGRSVRYPVESLREWVRERAGA